MFRNQRLTAQSWERARSFKVLGDWYLYLLLARGGKIAFHPKAVSYFRQHGANTSVEIQNRDEYYEEHRRVGIELRRSWAVPDERVFALYSQLSEQFARHKGDSPGHIHELFSVDELLATDRQELHVLIALLGFKVGGGEFFPIHLANALVRSGVRVSLLALDDEVIEPDMVALVAAEIPVYWSHEVRAEGSREFIDRTGVDVIHSHNIGSEGLFFLNHGDPLDDVAYVVTLHGSYEVSGLAEPEMSKIVAGVDVWVSTADRNLDHLRNRLWVTAPTLRFPNAVASAAISTLSERVSRTDLGIAEEALVFIVVSRPLEEKGWAEAIEAFVGLQASSERDLHLVLVGDGYERPQLERRWGSRRDILFLGFRTDVEELLALSDCCLLPTRFSGESQPLILIQAMKAGVPIVSTRIGSIPEMVGTPHDAAMLIEASDDNSRFVDELQAAMTELLDFNARDVLGAAARRRGEHYSMEALAQRYADLYTDAALGRVETSEHQRPEC